MHTHKPHSSKDNNIYTIIYIMWTTLGGVCPVLSTSGIWMDQLYESTNKRMRYGVAFLMCSVICTVRLNGPSIPFKCRVNAI